MTLDHILSLPMEKLNNRLRVWWEQRCQNWRIKCVCIRIIRTCYDETKSELL